MQVPTLKGSLVQAQPVGTPYAQADVSALSQGGGVAEGVSSIGGELADYAIKAKKQADQASEFEATADMNELADALHQDLVNSEGQATLQKYEKSLPEFDRVSGEVLARISSADAREAASQNARTIRGTLDARNKAVAEPKIFEASVKSNRRLMGSFGNSYGLVIANGGVRSGSTPNLPASVVGIEEGGTGTKAPTMLDERATAPILAAVRTTSEKFWDANSDHLGTDRQTYVDTAVALWKEEHYPKAISGMLARGDEQTARAFFEAHKADFNSDDIAKLDATTSEAVTIDTSQRAGASAWTTAKGDTISEREAAAKAGLSKGLTDAERAGAVEVIGNQADAERKQVSQTASDALLWMDKQYADGAALNDLKKLPAWRDLTAAGQRMMEATDEQRRNGSGELDPGPYADAIGQAANPATRQAFAKRDLLEDRQKFSKPQFDELMSIQASIRKGDGKAIAPLQTVDGIASDAAAVAASRFAGDESAAARAQFTANFYDNLREKQSVVVGAGKPWDPEAEALALRDRMLNEVMYDSDWRNSYGMVGTLEADVIDVDDIPADDLVKINIHLGAEATDELRQEAYLYLLTFGELPP